MSHGNTLSRNRYYRLPFDASRNTAEQRLEKDAFRMIDTFIPAEIREIPFPPRPLTDSDNLGLTFVLGTGAPYDPIRREWKDVTLASVPDLRLLLETYVSHHDPNAFMGWTELWQSGNNLAAVLISQGQYRDADLVLVEVLNLMFETGRLGTGIWGAADRFGLDIAVLRYNRAVIGILAGLHEHARNEIKESRAAIDKIEEQDDRCKLLRRALSAL